MKRSSSSSHIPLIKMDGGSRIRSKSSTRISNTKISTGGKTSMERLPVLKRSVSSTNLKKSSFLTPTLQSGGATYKRSISNTPSSSRSKSPFKYGSAMKERSVNDKKWVSEQFAKVRTYLQQHPACDEHIVTMIKPPTIKTFVFVINLLMKEIDPHIDINMTNYKEVVLSKLKLLKFPGNISNSLLKTVNTMHAWPQVISIFAWLVDLICTLQNNEIPANLLQDDNINRINEWGLNFFVKRYLTYNNDGDLDQCDKEHQELLEEILDIDNKKIEQLTQEVSELGQHKENQIKQLRVIEDQNNLIKKEIDALEFEIDTFFEEDHQKEIELDHMIATLKEKKIKKFEAIKEKQESITKLNQILQEQPCTYEEKDEILKNINEMKHSLDLKRENIAVKNQIKTEWNLKLSNAKMKIETGVYRLNMELMQLSMIEPELKVLQFTELDFTSNNFGEEVKKFVENIKRFEKKINDEIETTEKYLSENKIINKKLSQDLEALETEIEMLDKQTKNVEEELIKYRREIELAIKEREEQTKLFREKMNNLDESFPNVEILKQKLIEVTELNKTKQQHLTNLMNERLKYLENVFNKVMTHFQDLNSILTNTVNHINKCGENVSIEENNILKDLQNLLPLGHLDKPGSNSQKEKHAPK